MKKTTMLLIASILLSLGFHGYLTSQHYKLKLGLSAGSACNVSATFNCDAVAASHYSSVFNVPVALLGFTAHLVFLILLLAAQLSLSENSEAIRRILLWYSGFIALVSIVMGSISTFFLGTFCLFCMATYLLSFVQFAATWKIQTENPVNRLKDDMTNLLSSSRWVAILFVLIPAVAWLGNQIIMDNYGLSRLESIIKDEMANWQQNPVQNFSDKGLSKSNENTEPAKIVLVEFADFLCPHCKVASVSLDAFTQANKDVKFIFKPFPLDGKCNKAIERPGDGVRCKLAAAVICAENTNKTGWKAHHWIFENQERFFTGYDISLALNDIAKLTNNIPEEFQKCVDSDATYENIQAMAAEGAAAKIQGTPSIFINGKKVSRGQVLPVLQRIHDSLTGI